MVEKNGVQEDYQMKDARSYTFIKSLDNDANKSLRESYVIFKSENFYSLRRLSDLQ